ncbi:MAG: NAD(P)/FAD-dependent oxidoreductase [Planctomycetota bacterium]
MSLIYRNLSLSLSHDETELPAILARRLKLRPGQRITDWEILRKSLDSRRGRRPRYNYTVRVALEASLEAALLRRPRSPVVPYEAPAKPEIPRLGLHGGVRPVVVGAGPAGLFAAYRLAQAGCPPIVLERGPEVTNRSKRWYAFLKGAPFDPECNLLFGEGGAGTYSDGKLYTRVHDPRVGEVIRALLDAGAPREIGYAAKPHIGSNLLPAIVRNLRKQLIERGVEFRFDAKVVDVAVETFGNGRRLVGVRTEDGAEVSATAVFLAPGHSARDTYRMLAARGIPLVPKPFQMGVRVEHPQLDIDRLQYGEASGHPQLPPAEYQWVVSRAAGDVFSFCMCPGGEILPATERAGFICVNGASRHQRIGPHANSGFVVTVEPAEFGASDPLAGLLLQEQVEQRAARLATADFGAPALRLRDFLAQRISSSLPESSYPLALTPAPFEEFLPERVVESVRDGLFELTRRHPVLGGEQALVVGPESRSSSPVRIPRDENTYQVDGFGGLIPLGEGAGYAGGILSAAIDGLRGAEAWVTLEAARR